MQRILYFLLASTLALTACDELDIARDTPSCIRQRTINLERESPCTTDQDGIGPSVKEYRFQGQTVYVFDDGNCIADGSATVTDAECNVLGYLGGFGGSTTINGQSFNTAEYRRTIWEK